MVIRSASCSLLVNLLLRLLLLLLLWMLNICGVKCGICGQDPIAEVVFWSPISSDQIGSIKHDLIALVHRDLSDLRRGRVRLSSNWHLLWGGCRWGSLWNGIWTSLLHGELVHETLSSSVSAVLSHISTLPSKLLTVGHLWGSLTRVEHVTLSCNFHCLLLLLHVNDLLLLLMLEQGLLLDLLIHLGGWWGLLDLLAIGCCGQDLVPVLRRRRGRRRLLLLLKTDGTVWSCSRQIIFTNSLMLLLRQSLVGLLRVHSW